LTHKKTREACVQLAGMLAIAAAFSGYAMACVLAASGLVSAAAGEFNTTIGALSVVFAVTWIGACAWLSWRG
jgi:hypothetical protein